MSVRPPLEIAANSLASALAAQAGGADRIELCENLGEGGCTPSFGTIAAARDRLQVPLYVLIRPRGGDFHYEREECEVMLRDIETCVRLGCDGVVIGALDAAGDVDMDVCRALVGAAGSLGITFHRALDVARDPLRALDAAIELGCERVLTSGGQADALAGADAIATLVRHAAGRIGVMAGAGVDSGNIATLRARSHADEFHASAGALRRSSMRHRTALPGLAPDWRQSDRDIVAALRAQLQLH